MTDRAKTFSIIFFLLMCFVASVQSRQTKNGDQIVAAYDYGTETTTPTQSFTPTVTNTPTKSYTPTHTYTLTHTYTPTPSYTVTPSSTVPDGTETATYTETVTNTVTATYTPTSSFTATDTYTPTKTYTPTNTYTPTEPPYFKIFNTHTPTDTPTWDATTTQTQPETPTATTTNTPQESDMEVVWVVPDPIPSPNSSMGFTAAFSRHWHKFSFTLQTSDGVTLNASATPSANIYTISEEGDLLQSGVLTVFRSDSIDFAVQGQYSSSTDLGITKASSVSFYFSPGMWDGFSGGSPQQVLAIVTGSN
jgi:hypothetical protein